jgi:bis(5'-nucleosyl)-tetraphosphatase (symmetrical)
MAIYVIGDIQGCYNSFLALLKKIKFKRGRDKLWLVGDLINRGNGSLQVLRWCYKNKSSVTAVLGNHDLHALAIKYKVIEPDDEDTLSRLLKAKDSDVLFKCLKSLPLVHYEKKHLMVHAGILPQWTVKDAIKFSKELILNEKAYGLRVGVCEGHMDEKTYSIQKVELRDFFGNAVNASSRMESKVSEVGGTIAFCSLKPIDNRMGKIQTLGIEELEQVSIKVSLRSSSKNNWKHKSKLFFINLELFVKIIKV